ncbi:MAG: peptidoglycan DD-metalloendopeptidase family protein, partial [Anaerolineales bacterium]|nr:peptidoglycan DD-metalloendopeptidase family protein [Anaerolineales bacterium]
MVGRRRCRLGLALVGLVLGLSLGRPATAQSEVFVLDVRGDEALVLLLPEGELARRTSTSLDRLGVIALSARYLPDGAVAVVDSTLALRRLDSAGFHDWLPPGSANAPLFLSPDGLTLAYLKPFDLPPGEPIPLTNAVAALDLASGAERVLLRIPGVTPRLYGWAGSQLLLEIPAWQPATAQAPAQPAAELLLAALDPSAPAPVVPQALAALPPLAPGARYPQTSFDQQYLAYASHAGLVVASLPQGDFAVYPGAGAPAWTEAGLTAERAGSRQPLAWSPADLAPAPAASGPVALPRPAVVSEMVPAAPAAANAIIVYRPVFASTRVSAYFDLDRAVGAIRDWLGWVGGTWIYGRAYDQHSGSDYDGRTGDPVYAPAPGTVIRIVVDCANTYPNGPRVFGTYVRLAHGVQSDGASYETLVGHLQCDAVFTGEGANVLTLPTQLAQMGNTGWSSGDHTHLQVYRDGTSIDPYDWHIISDTPPASTLGDVQGLVRDANGQPAAGAAVKVSSGSLWQTTATGPDGRYSFSNVRIGAATLVAVRGPRWALLTVNVVAAATITVPDMTLSNCAGVLVAADGCPALTFDNAAYVADVTVPDTAVLEANKPLVKTWRLRNTGATPWGSGYQLVHIAGDQRGTPLAIDVPPTAPGAQVDLSTSLTTPAGPGLSRGYWRLRNDHGAYFGPTLWVELNTAVYSPAITAFTVSPASPSAAGSVHVYARVQGLANFRAMRLKIDGLVVYETTAAELNYDWSTAGLGAHEHSLTIEAATLTDTAWARPEQRGLTYRLIAAPAAAAGPAAEASSASASGAPPASVIAAPEAPPSPALQAPIAASPGTPVYVNDRTITFRWTASAGAASYTLHVGGSAAPKDEPAPLLREVLGAGVTSYTHTFGADYAALYWQVTAHDASGTSASPAQRFGIDRSAPSCVVQSLSETTDSTTLTVTWSGADDVSGLRHYEVQFWDTGRGLWRTWLRTPAGAAAFSGQVGHRYSFRCRATDQANNLGSYPAGGDTSTLIGSQGGQPNLRILDLAAAPNPAGGAWVRLTIQNDGGGSTERGFNADLYLNALPTGPGDYAGSVQLWVNEPLAAGATRALHGQVLIGSGQGTQTFYAQVDSGGTVAELDEGDNLHAAGVSLCVAAEDVFEDDGAPATALLLAPGASQARSFGGPGDQDWVRLGVQPGRFYVLNTSSLSPGVDTRLRLTGPGGQPVLAFNDDAHAATLASEL